jgi:hypothetical protein
VKLRMYNTNVISVLLNYTVGIIICATYNSSMNQNSVWYFIYLHLSSCHLPCEKSCAMRFSLETNSSAYTESSVL